MSFYNLGIINGKRASFECFDSGTIGTHEYLRTQTQQPEPIKKKWYGNSTNRSVSNVTRSNRILNQGQGTFTPVSIHNQQLFHDPNTIFDAKHRVRGQGCVAPPKCAYYPNKSGFY